MADEQLGEKTEPATQRKREESRKKGQVAKSMDLSSAVLLLVAVLVLALFGKSIVGGLIGTMHGILENLHTMTVDQDDLMGMYAGYFSSAMLGILPMLIALFVFGLAITFLQVGFVISGEALVPKFEKLNPISGMKRLFSLRGLVRMLQGLFKLAVIGLVGAITIWGERAAILSLFDRDLEGIIGFLLSLLFALSIRVILALLVLAILDFGYQRWQQEKDMRMSKQEVKEEMKRYEGDPKIKERRKAVQRQLALQRMMQRVPKATVVITNPTEYAVALEYDTENMDAPTVVAKGVEHMARRIREVALENAVPIVQRPEVARALYRTTEVGQTIPLNLYQAVAEILAYVYRLKGMAA